MLQPAQSPPAPASFATKTRGVWRSFALPPDREGRGRAFRIVAILGLILTIGVVDFLVGFELSLLVFYILPVCLAVAFVSWRFSVFAAVACVASWLIGDVAAGAHFENRTILFWNALFALGIYLVVIWMFNRLLMLQREMEERVRQRTVALTQMIAERERLEKALLEISERERRSIGHDLHDGLGQHLTGTALAGQVLADKLHARAIEEEADAWKVVALIEDGIEKTRRLARGFLLAEIQRDGLVPALQDLTAEVSDQFRVSCEFVSPAAELRLVDNDSATHLFRIAQEAVRNAIRHGRAKRIVVGLSMAGGVELTVRDFGVGLSEPRGRGLGLSIMAHRAEIIGGHFSIAAQPGGGTLVSCRLPPSSLRHD